MQPVKIRKCTSHDFDSIFQLLQQLFPNKELHASGLQMIFLEKIKSKNESFFCAEAEGRVIGFCSLGIVCSFWREGYVASINELVVDQFYRGQGVGSALVERAAEYAKENGCISLVMDSALHRERAHEFLLKSGFEKRAYQFSKNI